MTGSGQPRDRPALPSIGTAVALGLASGFLSAVMFRFEIDPIFWTGLADQPFLGLGSFPYPVLIALCFAVAVATVVRSAALWRWWTPPLLAVGIYAAWLLAIRSAIATNDAIRASVGDIPALAAAGAGAGLIGAALTLLTVAAVAPRLRSSGSFVTVGLAGLLTGPLLAIPLSVNEADLWRLAALFMPWQAAVTAALAFRLRRS